MLRRWQDFGGLRAISIRDWSHSSASTSRAIDVRSQFVHMLSLKKFRSALCEVIPSAQKGQVPVQAADSYSHSASFDLLSEVKPLHPLGMTSPLPLKNQAARLRGCHAMSRHVAPSRAKVMPSQLYHLSPSGRYHDPATDAPFHRSKRSQGGSPGALRAIASSGRLPLLRCFDTECESTGHDMALTTG